MTEIPNQRSILGIVVLLLILGGQNRGLGLGGSSGLNSLGNLSALGKNLPLDRFARDMHRVVAMMDQVEGLTQMSGLSQLVSAASAGQGSYSSLPSSSHIDGAANSVSNALSDTLTSLSGQDLSQLMEMAGPLMEMLGSRSTK